MRARCLTLVLAVLGQSVSAAPSQKSPPAPTPDGQGNYRFIWTDPDGTKREFVYVPAGKIAPTVEVAMSPYLDGWYLFDYALGNEAKAQQRLHACVGTVAMPVRTESTPADWEGRQPSDRVPRVGWYLARLSIEGGKDGIPPGESVRGFQLAGGSLPGVMEFQCTSEQDPTSVDRDTLPKWLIDQVDRIPWSVEEVRVRTIGPVIEQTAGTMIDLVSRIAHSYLEVVVASAHPRRTAIVEALTAGLEAAKSKDSIAIRASFSRLQKLLESSSSDRWSRELSEGLKICVAHVLSRL